MTKKLVLAAVALFAVFGSAQAQSRDAERIASDIYRSQGSIYDRGAYDDDQFWSREIHRRYGVDQVVLVERRQSGFTWLNILDDILRATLLDNHRNYRPYPTWYYDRSWYNPRRVVIDHRYDNRRYDNGRWDNGRWDNGRWDNGRWDNRRGNDNRRDDNRRDDHRWDNDRRNDNRRDDHRSDNRRDDNRRDDNRRSDRPGDNRRNGSGSENRDHGDRNDRGGRRPS